VSEAYSDGVGRLIATRRTLLLGLAAFVCVAHRAFAQAADHPAHRYFHLGTFRFESGDSLPRARLLYVTHGRLAPDGRNAVLVPSWYGGNHHGYEFMIGPGRALDPSRDFIVVAEMFGSGGSSSPSNAAAPHNGPRFPPVSNRDNVTAMHRLLTEQLGIRHLRAVVGFSMGAQQAFQWAVSRPDFVDRIVPICGTARTYPHGAVRLESAILTYQADSAFSEGHYGSMPLKGHRAWVAHWAAWVFSPEWWRRELYKPQWSSPEAMIDAWASEPSPTDPNDAILQARTWQRHDVGGTHGFEGDLARALGSIRAEVLYLPCSTDQYFPIGDAEYERGFIPKVRFVPIVSVWGHAAGAGPNPADSAFVNEEVARFLQP
jgi:homoserine O-acetyltransferase